MPSTTVPRGRSLAGLLVTLLAVALGTISCEQGPPAEGSLRVNINTCTLTELENIPGIGPELAKLIVARRPYESVDELLDVKGIGAKSLEKLRTYVKVDGETEKLR